MDHPHDVHRRGKATSTQVFPIVLRVTETSRGGPTTTQENGNDRGPVEPSTNEPRNDRSQTPIQISLDILKYNIT